MAKGSVAEVVGITGRAVVGGGEGCSMCAVVAVAASHVPCEMHDKRQEMRTTTAMQAVTQRLSSRHKTKNNTTTQSKTRNQMIKRNVAKENDTHPRRRKCHAQSQNKTREASPATSM